MGIRTYVWARFPLSRVKWLVLVPLLFRAGTAGQALTDAGGLADINGQIGLRPARLRLFGCSWWFGGLWQCPAYRLMVAAMRVQGNRCTNVRTVDRKSPDSAGNPSDEALTGEERRDVKHKCRVHVESNDVGGKAGACQSWRRLSRFARLIPCLPPTVLRVICAI